MRLIMVLACLSLGSCALIPQEVRESKEFKTACEVGRTVQDCARACAENSPLVQEKLADPKVARYYRDIDAGFSTALMACPVE